MLFFPPDINTIKLIIKQPPNQTKSNMQSRSETTRSNDILFADNFTTVESLNAITYSDVKTLANNSRAVYVNLRSKPIIIQTPKMVCPFGLSLSTKFDEEQAPAKGGVASTDAVKDPKYTLSLSFNGYETNEKLANFMTFLSNLDAKIKTDALQYFTQWLRQKTPSTELERTEARFVIKSMYTDMLRYSKNPDTHEINTKFAPTLRVKLPYNSTEQQFVPRVYQTTNGTDITQICGIENQKAAIAQGCTIKGLVQCTGLWFSGKGFGCSWKAVQLLVEPTARIGSQFSFLPDGEDTPNGDEITVTTATPQQQVTNTNVVASDNSNLYFDSEEEGEPDHV